MTTFRLRGLTRTLGLNPRRRAAPDAGPPGDTVAPSVPGNLVATAVSSSQIDLSWDASTDNVAVTGYNIYRDDVLVDTSPTNAYADTGLDPATEYEYEVSAFDAASNESARSAPDSASTHQAIVTAGLLAEWRFDEGTGQVLTDSTGNGHHGQLGSTTGADPEDPTWTAQGLSFGIGDYVECDTVGISGGAARTVICVTAPGDAGSGNTSFAVEWVGSTPGAPSNGTRWTLRCATGTDDLRLEIQGAGETEAALNFDVDVWAFVAATQSGDNLNTVTLYKDGATPVALSTSATINTAGNFLINSINNGHGQLQQMAYCLVYNRALSPAEIEQNRQALASILAARGITLPS